MRSSLGSFGPGLWELGVGDGWGGPSKRSVWSSVVVFIDKDVDQCLELFDGVGLWRLGRQPFLHGLVEAFDFPAGSGVVRARVFLIDPKGDKSGFEGVASSSVASESGGVDHAVVCQD